MDYLDVKRDDINYRNVYGSTYPLMKNAGMAVANVFKNNFGKNRKVLVIAGPGNNGGDAICAASYLMTDNDVYLLMIKDPKTPEARRAYNEYNGISYKYDEIDDLIKKTEIIVDGILGIGISGNPREPELSIIRMINSSGKKVISIDVPSGFPYESVKPDITVTFTDLKENMNESNSGKILIADIGIGKNIREYAGPGDLVYLKKPAFDSHKGMNGVLSIIGGSAYYGSAVISGLGAYSCGIDLVKIFTENVDIISSYYPGLIVRNIKNVDEMLKSNAFLIGPGLGTDFDDYDLLIRIISSGKPVVLDADALKIIKKEDVKGRNVIITPHKMEFKIFTSMEPSEESAVNFSEKYKITVLLKGTTDIVTDENRIMRVPGGNARMSMGGTGDLLSGMVSAFASRGVSNFRSAVMASYINKRVGEQCFKEKGYFYSITDMMDKIPSFINKNTFY
ncbi:bifunctional ADP-dependent NAD(P)H-hydrate dehydratase/NAD(P)H-hydrate epimerase [Picrophilus oshimae]|uniref:ADP-dependent (S)-NAD(P)H-hydrate dehydratase n=1 Tax=Picrophilus torridus (strain ATCC 700027 / DSM 9790 / JCM 10055 / NBRC 100828 / KAW 2/3) TaxID=1122961 RepID=Q6L1G0_PICTO|nr:bifunctional ADP-dependent NAD(P)H-hydrate dehydratase/NAD(P)H-hydrate epimerase [Picrophilus oshimae]AAT43192.1 putative sugar kinase [Picrophilus oshimae DSM 9789]